MNMFNGILFNELENDSQFDQESMIEFTEAKLELESIGFEFDQYCSAMDRLDLVKRFFECNRGQVTKPVITFLQQNGLMLDSFNSAFAEESFFAAYEGLIGDAWQKLKDFILKIYNGIKTFFGNLLNMFKRDEATVKQVATNANKIVKNIKAAGAAKNGPPVPPSPALAGNAVQQSFAAGIEDLKNGKYRVLKYTFVKELIEDLKNGYGNVAAFKGVDEILTSINSGDFGSSSLKTKNEVASLVNGRKEGEMEYRNNLVSSDNPDEAWITLGGWNEERITQLPDFLTTVNDILQKMSSGLSLLSDLSKMSDQQIAELAKKHNVPLNRSFAVYRNYAHACLQVAKIVLVLARMIMKIAKDLQFWETVAFKFNT